MISQLTTLKTSAIDRNIVNTKDYLAKPSKITSSLIEFLNKDFRDKSAVKFDFSDFIEPAELSYKNSHGPVGQNLDILSK